MNKYIWGNFSLSPFRQVRKDFTSLSVPAKQQQWLVSLCSLDWYRKLNAKTQHGLIIACFPYGKSDYEYETGM